MEFRKTEGSIIALRNKPSINVDEMLGLIACVVRDCYKNNDVKDVTGMSVGNQKKMVLNLNAVASMLLQAARGNTTSFNELRGNVGQRVRAIIEELGDVGSDYDKTSKSVKELIAKEKELEEKKAKLEAEQSEYSRLKKECKKLQADIDALSDTDINKIKTKRNDLKEELAKRQDRKKNIDDKVSELQDTLEETNKAIEGAEVHRKDIQSSIASAKQKRESLQGDIEKLQKDLNEVETWIREFPEIHKGMLEESKRHETIMALLRTSMNGIFSDAFLTENLFSKTSKPEKLTPEDYPDLDVASGKINSVADLKAWADGLMERIQSLIDIYQEELKRLVKCSDHISEAGEVGK